jgi:hypothetical protein
LGTKKLSMYKVVVISGNVNRNNVIWAGIWPAVIYRFDCTTKMVFVWVKFSIFNKLSKFWKQKMIFFQTGVWQIQLNLTIMAVLGYQKVVDVQRWLLLVVRLTVIMSFEQVSDQPLFTGLTVQQKWYLYESNSAY